MGMTKLAAKPRVVLTARIEAGLVEMLNETAVEFGVSRNKLVDLAIREWLNTCGERLADGETVLEVLGLVAPSKERRR